MQIKELLYKTPEMTEDRLKEFINDNTNYIKISLKRRLNELHKTLPLSDAVLTEFDLIYAKESKLSKSQRDFILQLVSYCLVLMTKNNDK